MFAYTHLPFKAATRKASDNIKLPSKHVKQEVAETAVPKKVSLKFIILEKLNTCYALKAPKMFCLVFQKLLYSD